MLWLRISGHGRVTWSDIFLVGTHRFALLSIGNQPETSNTILLLIILLLIVLLLILLGHRASYLLTTQYTSLNTTRIHRRHRISCRIGLWLWLWRGTVHSVSTWR